LEILALRHQLGVLQRSVKRPKLSPADFTQGIVGFVVEGLVLVGGNASGTPALVTSVKGTPVCNPGAADQVTRNTALVPLSSQGNAAFSGNFADGAPPATCTNPLFLIRLDAGAWLATGAVREP
jgi:hypothetical protein